MNSSQDVAQKERWQVNQSKKCHSTNAKFYILPFILHFRTCMDKRNVENVKERKREALAAPGKYFSSVRFEENKE